ncbi:protein FAM241B-like [Ptychodera flava]|uniref:protein FAM241B-like n=1 Tax=Ptychodera flava TaxID=63121 RepID=UPI00396A3B5D
MVKILANGEIVPDDDPRVRQSSSRRPDTAGRPRQGFVQHENYNQQYAGGQMQQVSIFDNLNQRLLDAGVPRWNLGSYVVEPIASVGMLLALLFFGLQGLLFAGLIFFVVKWSQQNQGQRQ